MNKEYVAFWKPNNEEGIFSQWFMAPITIDGILFNCNEQYMMYAKAILFGDLETAKLILETDKPSEIRKLGRLVKNFDTEIWGKHKETIVYKANYAKFTQNLALKAKLLETEDKMLIEASPYDNIWGVGMRATDKDIADPSKWKGLNLLGKAITKVRIAIKKELKTTK